MRATASGHGQVNQAQTQVIYQYGRGDQGKAAAVVEQVLAHSMSGPAVFVGRDRQVDELLAVLNPAGPGPGPGTTVVSAIGGLGGIGKTALVRRAAGLAVEGGWFPGGALLVDLHGYDPDPADRVAPGQVFASVLRALGLPADQIPPVVEKQAAVYHRLLAQRAKAGQPVLLVFDNASTTDQLTGLLPRHQAHRALVTSRHTLGELDEAQIVNLDVLDPAEAVNLVNQALRQRDPADTRISDHPGDALGLVGMCGRLPLALRIAAALLADDPAMAVSGLVDELADAATRLDSLAYGSRGVAATFDLSWHHLTGSEPVAARLFRLLPVNPGPDIATDTAAALIGQTPAQVRPLLRILRQAHLIEGSTAGRWRMHDLVRAYAIRLDGDERGEAIARLLAYYTMTAEAANDHLQALPGSPVPDRFTGRRAALEWLDTERANLLPTIDLAAATGNPAIALYLALALARFLSWRRHLNDWVTAAAAAARAADHLTDPQHRAAAVGNLGLALAAVRRFDEAITAHQTACDIYQKTGNRHGEAIAWNNLGRAMQETRRFEKAIAAHQRAADIYQKTGDRHGQAETWNNLGTAMLRMRRFEKAIAAHQRAADIYQKTGDRHGQAETWNLLGVGLREVRRFDEAIAAHQRAADTYQETGDPHGEGTAWNNLGLALQEVRRFDEAIAAHQRAADTYLHTDDLHTEAMASNNLGMAFQRMRRFDEAIAAHQRAADIYQETGDRHSEGTAWNNLGTAFQRMRRFDEAIAAHQRAADIYQETGDRHSQGAAWNNLGAALAEMNRFDQAIAAHQRAADIYRETGDRHGQGTASSNLALAFRQVGRFDEAITVAEHAVAAFTETGAADDAEGARRLVQALKDASGPPEPESKTRP